MILMNIFLQFDYTTPAPNIHRQDIGRRGHNRNDDDDDDSSDLESALALRTQLYQHFTHHDYSEIFRKSCD
jgi:hypothetical protein